MNNVRERFCLQFVGELPEFVEIDTRPKSERVGHGLRRRVMPGRGSLTQASTDRSVDSLLEWHAEFPGSPFQQSREIVIERKGCSHV
jgi:hypothetical protein